MAGYLLWLTCLLVLAGVVCLLDGWLAFVMICIVWFVIVV